MAGSYHRYHGEMSFFDVDTVVDTIAEALEASDSGDPYKTRQLLRSITFVEKAVEVRTGQCRCADCTDDEEE